jgi:magnesium chelatase subunit I
MSKPRTIGELRASGYQSRTVKQELRDNLIARLKKGAGLFPGIVGYEESVLPQIENAILSGQDIVFLGERGQAKTRMARLLTELLDDEMPGMAGCEINDNPFAPICQACRQAVAERGDKAEIGWIPRDRRYGEKLATPDITIADLIGEVDPIKVAEGRYLADELTIHYGLVPRTNRGIFAINELPDLAERIQVGLLNIMEERDVQIRGYKVSLPIDVYVVASANPEDYTNRGRIITPLKDRFGSQIRTHYPRKLEDEIAIMEAELTQFPAAGFQYAPATYMKQVVAELTHLARKAPEISQRSGVSVRVSICNWENLLSNALKRAIRLDEREVAPRVSDLGAIVASTSGKIELETLGDGGEDKVLGKLVQKAVLNVFNRSFTGGELDAVVAAFQGGFGIDVADSMPSPEYVRQIAEMRALQPALKKLGAGDPASTAAALEFVLEGLHLSRKLNKDSRAGRDRYRSLARRALRLPSVLDAGGQGEGDDVTSHGLPGAGLRGRGLRRLELECLETTRQRTRVRSNHPAGDPAASGLPLPRGHRHQERQAAQDHDLRLRHGRGAYPAGRQCGEGPGLLLPGRQARRLRLRQLVEGRPDRFRRREGAGDQEGRVDP